MGRFLDDDGTDDGHDVGGAEIMPAEAAAILGVTVGRLRQPDMDRALRPRRTRGGRRRYLRVVVAFYAADRARVRAEVTSFSRDWSGGATPVPAAPTAPPTTKGKTS